MSHLYQLGQSVVPTVYVRELNAVYRVVRLLPEDVSGEPQYRLRNQATGVEIVSREPEMKAFVPGEMPVGRG